MVAVRDFPLIDPRTREDFLAELIDGVEPLKAAEGGLLHTLLTLYSGMIADTVGRLNRTPEKHRLAFLNLLQTPRRMSRPSETIAVFEVTAGYELPVNVPEGAVISAQAGDTPVLYRTKWAFNAIPAKILDIFWTDSEADTAAHVFAQEDGEPQKPFRLWDRIPPAQGQHTADFLFQSILTDSDGDHEVLLTAELLLDGAPLDCAVLADRGKFLWSVYALPDGQDGDAPGFCVPVCARPGQDGTILLSHRGFLCTQPAAYLRLELVDAEYAGFCVRTLSLLSAESDIPPTAVVTGDREVDVDAFYPFEAPMQSLGECFIFCGNALMRPGAEIALVFDLALWETLWELPEEPETVDYKWVMKRPPQKPAPKIAEAFARSVRWEYWNGSAYCALRGKYGDAVDFTREDNRIELVFDCPPDLAEGSAGGRTGYFLRLSCGLCDELYKLPRRVYTPQIQNLRFSYLYRKPVFPDECTSENFGERRTFSTGEEFSPFRLPPQGQRIFIGLDSMPRDTRVQFFFNTEACRSERTTFMTARSCGDAPQSLVMDDGTCGLTRGGIVSVVLPRKPELSSLFGKLRSWICFTLPERQTARTMKCVYLNAQRVENRVRHRQHYSFSAIGLDGVVLLPHGNITQAWVFVREREKAEREEDNWTRWAEYNLRDGEFCDGFYTLDYTAGTLAFPPQILARAAESPGADFIMVTYDVCDGVKGNVEAGAINRMQEEIPFIDAVYNPLVVANGEDSESDAKLAARAEHRLYHGGRAVSARDFELIACDLYPQIHEAKCVAGRPVRLALMLKDSGSVDFQRMRIGLMLELKRVGCTAAMGTSVEIFQAVPVPIYLQIRFAGERHIFSMRIEQVQRNLAEFLHPVSGGLRGDGWRIGRLPTYEQISAYIAAQTPNLSLTSLIVTAEGGGLYGDWRKVTGGEFHVPGQARIEVEVDE